MHNAMQQGHDRGSPATAIDEPRVAPNISSFAAGTRRADRAGWRCRPAEQFAGLLAYLACTAPQPQPRERLAALLWGSYFDAQAEQNLRRALFRLRKMLGQDARESQAARGIVV